MLSEREQKQREYRDLIDEARGKGKANQTMKLFCLGDLYFLLTHVLRQGHIDEGCERKRDWLFDRCREVQQAPDGYLDLWAREHYKSTIITFGKTIQDVLADPELTVGIFSFNRPIAKQFLNQIKRELEENEALLDLFPEILWRNPEREAPKWSENDGLVVKRKGNPKESTIEAWGLVDGQPTSKHFGLMVYDDMVSRESVTTPEQIQKVTTAWELSQNLGKQGGRKRYIGTYYHFADTYHAILERGAATPRIYPGTRDGKADGEPVLFTPEYLAEKRRDMGSFVFSCQILLNPRALDSMGFNEQDLRYWSAQVYDHLNLYLLVDPAGSKKKKGNDYSVFMVVGLGPDENYYLVDMIRDRLNLNERAARLFSLHRKYRPLAVGYEEYSMQGDIEHCQELMERKNYRFDITPLKGRVAKTERIGMLVPLFEGHRFYLPESLPRVNYEGMQEDLVRVFRNEEFKTWPYSSHDDMLDCMARVLDPELGAEFPAPDEAGRQEYADAEWNELDYGREAA